MRGWLFGGLQACSLRLAACRSGDWRVFFSTSGLEGVRFDLCSKGVLLQAASRKLQAWGGPCSQPPPHGSQGGSQLEARGLQEKRTPWGARVVFWWLAGSQLAARGLLILPSGERV